MRRTESVTDVSGIICDLCVRFGPVGSGAREPQVEEPLSGSQSILTEFELDEVAEPKALSSQNLRKLVFRYGSHRKVAIKIGASEAFVRQNSHD